MYEDVLRHDLCGFCVCLCVLHWLASLGACIVAAIVCGVSWLALSRALCIRHVSVAASFLGLFLP
jgi:hypothetical protein